jgi:hypothetical protein
MVYLFVKEILLLLAAWAVFLQVRFLYRWRVFGKRSRQNGCEEAPVYPNKLPWGIERFAFLFNRQLASTFCSVLRSPLSDKQALAWTSS